MKKPLLAVVAVLLVLVGILLTLLLPRPSKVTRAHFEGIEVGMSKPEVEEILGGPPGDYRDRPTYLRHSFSWRTGDVFDTLARTAEECSWHGNEGAVEVTFDHAGEVLWTEFHKTEAEGGCLNALRWRLERRWERLWGR